MSQIVNEFPNALEMEKKLYRAIVNVYLRGTPPDVLLVEEELEKRGEFIKVRRSYLFALIDYEFTTSRAEKFALIIKEKANLRKFIKSGVRPRPLGRGI